MKAVPCASTRADNNKIVKISLKHSGYMGDPSKDPSTIDSSKVFDELANNMKALTIEE